MNASHQAQLPYQNQYRAYTLLSMLYITLVLSANVLIYKIVQVGSVTFTVGSLVTPFWFVLTDIIAEVYGFKMAKRLIWSGMICACLFAIVCYVLIHFTSPPGWPHQHSYDQVLGKLPRIFLGSVAGVMIGAFLNSYLITKWKILTNGKYFWLRSSGSSICGQLIFTMITIISDTLGILSYPIIFSLIGISMMIKLIVTPVLAILASVVVYYLKKSEGVDVYDYDTNFNPFKLSANN